MGRIIRITEKQLREVEDQVFSYSGDSDLKTYDGNTDVTVNGTVGDNEYGEPVTSDKVADTLIPQAYARYRLYGRNGGVRCMGESTEDKNGDGVDDFYNNDELDILGNEDENDNLTKIPKGVETKTEVLLGELRGLTPKQRAIILNRIIEGTDTSSIPYAWKKELIKKISL
ncbi:MAG: hypothetical protein LUD72_01020 [Bacteroidales bacterium]|nr:hypothetical protein [Bacteroidales bacterium]